MHPRSNPRQRQHVGRMTPQEKSLLWQNKSCVVLEPRHSRANVPQVLNFQLPQSTNRRKVAPETRTFPITSLACPFQKPVLPWEARKPTNY